MNVYVCNHDRMYKLHKLVSTCKQLTVSKLPCLNHCCEKSRYPAKYAKTFMADQRCNV